MQNFYENDQERQELFNNPIQTPKIPSKQKSKDFLKPAQPPLPICENKVHLRSMDLK